MTTLALVPTTGIDIRKSLGLPPEAPSPRSIPMALSTTFLLIKQGSPHKRVTVPNGCPFLRPLPDEVQALVAEGWRVAGHTDLAVPDAEVSA